MQARMKNIVMIVPDALQALQRLKASAEKGGVPSRTLDYDEPAVAALIIAIANINVWNRFNVATRQVAGAWSN